MDDVLIPSLAEMAKAGLKVDKSFKRQAFVEAANIVNSKFPSVSMDADNVENHMCTMKMKYQEIKKLMALSGVGWNEDLKMIVVEDETYRTYVESYPKAKELLNKPIPHFEDLRIVCGDYHATGDFSRTIFHQYGSENNEVDSQNVNIADDMETEPSDNNNNIEGEAARTSTNNRGPRRNRAPKTSSEGTSLDTIGNKFDRLAATIDNSSKDWKEKMSDALWSMEGYDDDDDMEEVYLALRANRDLAEDFYMRKPSLRKKFLDQFIANRRSSDY